MATATTEEKKNVEIPWTTIIIIAVVALGVWFFFFKKGIPATGANAGGSGE